ncbi:MAG: DNA-directed RNA polymerase subunit K [Candidatus Nanoarchaeia archaeon]
MSEEFSKYEKARILGARALQISMNAPLLIKLNKDRLDELHYDPLRIAEVELDEGVLPISVNRPMPARKEGDIEKIKIKEEVGDEKKIKQEEREVKEIAEEGEIMELANPEDEQE